MAVTYGWITGSVLQPIADTETADDRTPTDRPSAGEVILTPLIAATADGKIIARDSIRRPLDADGYIVDLNGGQGVAVPVGSYRVEWALTSGRWPAHDITVTAEHTQAAPYDIGTQAPVTPAPGAPVTLLEVPSGAYADAILGWGDGLEWQPNPTSSIPGAVQDYLTANPPTADLTGYVQTTDPRLADARTPTAHTHDDRYYTESEADALLAGKQAAGSYAATSHNHDGTYSPIGHNHTGTYAPALGPDDNYVTAAEKTKLANLSGVNTGDQTLPTWGTIAGKPAVVAAGADAATARAAIGAGTSSFSGAYADLSGKPVIPDTEAIQDVVGGLVVGAGGTYDDDAGTITLPSGGASPYELRGTGMPNGLVTAPVGTYYTDTVSTNGATRWYKASGTGNTGWIVIVGDTDWRKITVTFITSGSLFLRRVNNLCYVSNGGGPNGASTFSGLNTGVSTGGTSNPIPQGWRTSAACITPLTDDGNSHNGFLVLTSTDDASVIQVRGAVTQTIENGRIVLGVYVPSDPWPTTLPGTAV